MKENIRKQIQEAIRKVYPDHSDIAFSVDYAPANVAADFASNVALVLAKKLGKGPMEMAEEIAAALKGPRNDELLVEAAAPGFINFKLPAEAWHEELAKIIKQGEAYGANQINSGKKARVEYVSANPTGPVHVGNARGGPYGEVICRVLEKTGYEVLREYIHNDVGGQVEKLAQTIWYWYRVEHGVKFEIAEDYYKGEYPREIALAAIQKLGHGLTEQDVPKLLEFAINYIFAENLETMKRLGIEFDLIVSERELQSSGKVQAVVEEMKTRGMARENEGALWFAPSDEFLGDREAVIVKSNGSYTYFASDIAYHKEKFTSGYDLVIDIFGSNHHGHVPKLQALTKIYSFDPEKFKVLLYQYVRVKKGKEVVKMAKRAGNFITAKEVLDEVGKDSMIFFLLSTAQNTHMDFDLELAKDTSEKNPVYKVQYAHARIESLLRKAPPHSNPLPQGERELMRSEELSMIRVLAKFPELVSEISQTYHVHQLPHYLLEVAEEFHRFYEKVRVISDDERQTASRLALVKAVQSVIASGLKLMAIQPLKKM